MTQKDDDKTIHFDGRRNGKELSSETIFRIVF